MAKVNKYNVVLKYKVADATSYEVYAHSEEDAADIARHKISHERRDYADLSEITVAKIGLLNG
jgi:hypothetical protein